MGKAKDTSSIEWSDYFYYDESSPTFLRHKVERRNVKKDSVAGSTKNSTGRAHVRLFGDVYFAHRVIWELFYNRLESHDQIDHFDGDKLNNSISNLRKVSNSMNQKNKMKKSSNTSGFTGVCFNETGYWVSIWYDEDNGKMKSKYFSIKKFGLITAKMYAILHRQTMLSKVRHLGYTERHGL